MPPYDNSLTLPPFSPDLLLPGVDGYAFGSLNRNAPITRMAVTSVAIATNVATLAVKVLEGDIPTVGRKISVSGTSTDAGAANVNAIALSTVSINSLTGIGTVTYAATGGNQVTTPDTGMAYVAVSEVGETLVNASSKAFALPSVRGGNGMTLTWSTLYPSAPAGVTMTLQAAMEDIDAQYTTLDTSTNASGDIRSITLTLFRFVRVTASGVSGGTLPTSIVRIAI
jgi:hypothetical protein